MIIYAEEGEISEVGNKRRILGNQSKAKEQLALGKGLQREKAGNTLELLLLSCYDIF